MRRSLDLLVEEGGDDDFAGMELDGDEDEGWSGDDKSNDIQEDIQKRTSLRRYVVLRQTSLPLRIRQRPRKQERHTTKGMLMWFYLWVSQSSRRKSVGSIPGQ